MNTGILYSQIKTIFNKKCWKAKRGLNTVLMLEFGEIIPQLGKNDKVHLFGDHGLLIDYCDWIIEDKGKEWLVSWDKKQKIDENISEMLGDEIVDFENEMDYSEAKFKFKSGKTLKTITYKKPNGSLDFEYEAWTLFKINISKEYIEFKKP